MLCVNICAAGTAFPLSRWVFQPPCERAFPSPLIFKCFTQSGTALNVLVVRTCFRVVGDLLQIQLWIKQGWDVNFCNFPSIWQPDEPHPSLPLQFFQVPANKMFHLGRMEGFIHRSKGLQYLKKKKKSIFSNNVHFHCFYSAARLNQTFALPYVLLWLTASITRNKSVWYIITGVEGYCSDVTPPLLLHLCNSSVLASLSVSPGEVTILVVA